MSVHTTIHPNRYNTERRWGAEFDQAGSGSTTWIKFSLRQWDHDTYLGSDESTTFVDMLTTEEVDAAVKSHRKALRELVIWNEKRKADTVS